jgi:hypothetical protein
MNKGRVKHLSGHSKTDQSNVDGIRHADILNAAACAKRTLLCAGPGSDFVRQILKKSKAALRTVCATLPPKMKRPG